MKLPEFDKIKFLFKRPNYKKGDSVRFWNETYSIIEVYRDWEFCTFVCKLKGSDINPSEEVLKFYNKNIERRRY